MNQSLHSFSRFKICSERSGHKWVRSLFWTCLLSARAHTLKQSEGRVEMIQSHIWSFCKTSTVHNPQLTRGKNKRTQRETGSQFSKIVSFTVRNADVINKIIK